MYTRKDKDNAFLALVELAAAILFLVAFYYFVLYLHEQAALSQL